MKFKEDWDKCKARFDAFWEGEIIDRCVTSVLTPRKNTIDVEVEHITAKNLEEKWLDCKYRYSQAIHSFANTYFGGEAFPNFQINLGPGVVASYMGASYTLQEGTVWFGQEPFPSDWDSLFKLALDEQSIMWEVTNQMLDFFTSRANGDYMVCNTDLGGTLDIAASFRGTQRLLTDLYDYPDETCIFRDKIDDIWLACYNRVQDVINKFQDGSTDWYPTWCREKRSYSIQCDFCAMISPAQFEKFVQPSIIRQAEAMDRAIYHLDGPGQIPHIDHLLDINKLDGIQWVPGSGNPGGCDEKWYPLYQKIQSKGKKLIITSVENDKIEKLLDNISIKGVFLQTSCETEEDAKHLLALIEKLSVKRLGCRKQRGYI